jgi:hypothetical protein
MALKLAEDRVNVRESLFAAAFNGLLRHERSLNTTQCRNYLSPRFVFFMKRQAQWIDGTGYVVSPLDDVNGIRRNRRLQHRFGSTQLSPWDQGDWPLGSDAGRRDR